MSHESSASAHGFEPVELDGTGAWVDAVAAVDAVSEALRNVLRDEIAEQAGTQLAPVTMIGIRRDAPFPERDAA